VSWLLERRRAELFFDAGHWRDRTACKAMQAELFFPTGERGEAAIAQTTAAKQVCARCEARLHCLVFALVANPRDGIWGGLDPGERRALRRAPGSSSLAPRTRRRSLAARRPGEPGSDRIRSASPHDIASLARVVGVGRCSRGGKVQTRPCGSEQVHRTCREVSRCDDARCSEEHSARCDPRRP